MCRKQRSTRMVDRTTAELACASRGATRSAILSASRASAGLYFDRACNMNTCPHLRLLVAAGISCRVKAYSVQSFKAARRMRKLSLLILKTSSLLVSSISERAATALATTMGLESAKSSRSMSRKPCVSTSSGLMSHTLATHTAAVLRT
jgi:hypothetical protein